MRLKVLRLIPSSEFFRLAATQREIYDADCKGILDKQARLLATFLFLAARDLALPLWKSTNAVVSSPDSRGFGLQVRRFSETHPEV